MVDLGIRSVVSLITSARRGRCRVRNQKHTYARYFERLEERKLFHTTTLSIAPSGKSATFTDFDGDIVTVAVTKGTLVPDDFSLASNATFNNQLQLLMLTDPGFSGTNLTISVKKVAGGDGLTNVGYIDATGNNLGTVSIIGDLGRIDAGADTAGTPAIKSLSVRSMGRLGTDTQISSGADLDSNILGALGSLTVAGDVKDAFILITSASSNGNLGATTIGGSVIGGDDNDSGSIRTTGNMGNVTIGGDVVGGDGAGSGRVISGGTMGNVNVGGSLIGGAGQNSGLVGCTDNLGKVTVGGDLRGGPGFFSASISALNIAGVTVDGSLIGDAGDQCASIQAGGALGAVTVLGNIQGGSGANAGSILAGAGLTSVTVGGFLNGGAGTNSGQILSVGDTGAVKIGRSVDGGGGDSSGAVVSEGKLGAVTIGGSLAGGDGGSSGSLQSGGNMGQVKIAGSLIGGMGAGASSGEILLQTGALAGVTIGGSIVGGATTNNGSIQCLMNDMGPVKVAGDVGGGAGDGSGSINSAGALSSFTLGGSVIGGGGDFSGQVLTGFNMGPVKISGDIRGADGLESGLLNAGRVLASAAIGGSVVGGGGVGSGAVVVGNDLQLIQNAINGAITISGDVVGGGGAGSQAGRIEAENSGLAAVSIGGSLLGGSQALNGAVVADLDIGSIKIGRNFIGGGTTASSLENAGVIMAQSGRIGSVTIGGSIIAGVNDGVGALTNDASILAFYDIGSINVHGSIVGSSGSGGVTPVVISAAGPKTPGATTDLAIGSITVGGRVEWTNFLAGYDTDLNPVSGGAQIGNVKIGGDFIASNLVAGVQNIASGDTNFGSGDTIIINDPSSTNASIAKVVIGGVVLGTPQSVSSADHFGIVARRIGSLSVNGASLSIGGNPVSIALGQTGDDSLVQIAVV